MERRGRPSDGYASSVYLIRKRKTFRCWTLIRQLYVADAYDMVINGVEVGGGSIRIHDAKLQAKMFEILGFTPEKAEAQFGFLMNAFKYGAPPHGGLAYGLDRWVSLFAGLDSIRDCIAFPKNNSGRDVMLDAPSAIDQSQLDELNLIVDLKEGE